MRSLITRFINKKYLYSNIMVGIIILLFGFIIIGYIHLKRLEKTIDIQLAQLELYDDFSEIIWETSTIYQRISSLFLKDSSASGGPTDGQPIVMELALDELANYRIEHAKKIAVFNYKYNRSVLMGSDFRRDEMIKILNNNE